MSRHRGQEGRGNARGADGRSERDEPRTPAPIDLFAQLTRLNLDDPVAFAALIQRMADAGMIARPKGFLP